MAFERLIFGKKKLEISIEIKQKHFYQNFHFISSYIQNIDYFMSTFVLKLCWNHSYHETNSDKTAFSKIKVLWVLICIPNRIKISILKGDILVNFFHKLIHTSIFKMLGTTCFGSTILVIIYLLWFDKFVFKSFHYDSTMGGMLLVLVRSFYRYKYLKVSNIFQATSSSSLFIMLFKLFSFIMIFSIENDSII